MKLLVTVLLCLLPSAVLAQSEARPVGTILSEPIVSPEVSLFQLRQYILSRVAKPPAPASAQQWTAESRGLRERLLKEVVFHGWPQAWVTAPPKFEDLGLIGSGHRVSDAQVALRNCARLSVHRHSV